ncbi:MAG: hypothetical protein A2X64_01280 [Ignavibacteria bacterium GWF2_33_9]|nr:MAG: hypothetical protein A2X64_01280 [Ignavibacteria bacterium GWF2_33_9]
MKKITTNLFLILLLVTGQVFARPNVDATAATKGYYIKTAGNTKDGKWYTLAKNQFVKKIDSKYYLQNAVNVKFKDKIEISNDKKSLRNPSIQTAIKDYGISNISAPYAKYVMNQEDKIGISRIYQINYDKTIDPYLICEELMKNPEVEYASPIFIRELYEYSPNDPQFQNSNQYFLDVLKMRQAWEISKGSKDVKIAIVDNAIDITHQDLADNIWTNPNEIEGNGIDDDNNGFKDDVHGWDFVGNITGLPLRPDNDTKPLYAAVNHGTHTSGCASAVTNNSVGVASVGHSCSIIPIKVGSDNPNVGSIIAGYDGILYAANIGADIINCSWGGPGFSQAEKDIVDYAISKGCILVVSGGNYNEQVDDGTNYPASFEGCFTVGASGTNSPASFTAYGINVDIFAPGLNIVSTLPGNNYGGESGTSMSSPIVAGLFGLLKSLHPDWTPMQLQHQIRATANKSLTSSPSLKPYYYGNANAFDALRYNNNDANYVMPGISMESVMINGASEISSFEDNEVKASFKNYLGDADSVTIEFIPINDWLTVTDGIQTIPAIKANEIKEATIHIQITDKCPWFFGDTRIIVKITAQNNYVNYELISLPINLPSNNIFTTRINQLTDITTSYISTLHMYSESNGWAAGMNRLDDRGLFHKITNNNFTSGYISSEPTYCVYGFDANKALIGTGTDDAVGTSHIYITTNGGTNWTTVNTSNITNFINFIHFWDDQNGIFLGDAVGSQWGIATTSDGGYTWNLLSTMPDPLSAEDGLVGSGQFEGDEIWFGTNMGRIFYSPDRGQTWSVSNVMLGKAVTDLTFLDKNTGVAIVSEDLRATSSRYPASTSDGMVTWKTNTNLDFTANNLYPIYTFAPQNSGKIYMLFSTGEVFYSENLWATFQPELTKKFAVYVCGSHRMYNGKVRLFHVGNAFSTLDFIFNAAVIEKKIALAEASPVDFGDIETSKTKTKFIKIDNVGNTLTNIYSSEVIPGANTSANEFEVKTSLPSDIDVGSSMNFRVAFSPIDGGAKSATIRLTTDGDPNTFEFEVIGQGILSVYEIASPEILAISPNPSNSLAYVKFQSKSNAKSNITLYDNLNRKVFENTMDMIVGENEFNLDVSKLNTGMYFLIISDGSINYVSKLIKE